MANLICPAQDRSTVPVAVVIRITDRRHLDIATWEWSRAVDTWASAIDERSVPGYAQGVSCVGHGILVSNRSISNSFAVAYASAKSLTMWELLRGGKKNLLHDPIQMAIASPMELRWNTLLMLTNWLMHFNGVASSVRSKNIVWAIISRFSVWSFGECLVESDGTIAAVLGQMIFWFMVLLWQ